MRATPSLVSAFSAAAILLTLAAASFAAEPEWLKDYDEARIVSAGRNKPIFAVIRCER
jgi:hypothetical protein